MLEDDNLDRTNLLLSVAEQLKVPLSVIARHAELAQMPGDSGQTEVQSIGVQADAALKLVDSYLLGLELERSRGQMPLEPVSVPSVLADTAQELLRYGKAYGIDIDLGIQPKCAPVMASRRGLRAALLSLGFELIEAQAAQAEQSRPRLVLAAHRSYNGVVAGMYGQYDGLSIEQWRKSLSLVGRARQPLASVSAGSSAGLFVADAILRAMFARLRPTKYHNEHGLAATLPTSQQLSLV